MSKFRKGGKKEAPAIATSSLPDIVFMILIFFMVTVKMRDVSLKVHVVTPQASELSKMEKKSLVSNIYVGEPDKQYQKMFGTEPRIQLNDALANVSDIVEFIIAEREARDEAEIPFLITSLKVDEFTKMGIVQDIKQELRRASALHINYSARKKVKLD